MVKTACYSALTSVRFMSAHRERKMMIAQGKGIVKRIRKCVRSGTDCTGKSVEAKQNKYRKDEEDKSVVKWKYLLGFYYFLSYPSLSCKI